MSALAEQFKLHSPGLLPYLQPTSHPPDVDVIVDVWGRIVDIIEERQAERIRSLALANAVRPEYVTLLVKYKIVANLALKLGADSFSLQDYQNPSFERYQYLLKIFDKYLAFRDRFRLNYVHELQNALPPFPQPARPPSRVLDMLNSEPAEPKQRTSPKAGFKPNSKSVGKIDYAKRIPELKKEITELTQALEAETAGIALAKQFTGRGEALAAEVAELKQRVERAAEESKQAQLNDELCQKLITEFSELETPSAQLIALKNSVAETKTKIAELNTRISLLRTQHERLVNTVESHREETSKVQTDLIAAESERLKCKEHVNRLRQWQESIANAQNRTQNSTARSIDADISDLVLQCRQLETDIRVRSKWIEDMKTVDALGSKIESELRTAADWARK